MLVFVRSLSYTALELVLLTSFPYTLYASLLTSFPYTLYASLARSFSYTPDASFYEKFLLYSASWFYWEVSLTLLTLVFTSC